MSRRAPHPCSGVVAVTGANGFIGTHLCRELADHGVVVRAVVHHATSPVSEGTRIADVSDREAVHIALDGADAVVHLAGRAHMTRDRAIDPLAEYRRVNVGGTRVVLDAMHQTGARRLILVSSVKAVGVALPRGSPPWQDDVEPHPSDPYGVSKLEAERLVLDQAAGAGIRATIIRLPLVYGPGVRANMLALFRLVNRGFPLPFGRVENRRSLAYVGNAVSAIASLLEVDDGPGPYFVSDGHDLSTPELIRAIARAMNMRAPLFPVPVSSLRLTRDIARLLAQILPTSALADAMERLVESLAVDSSTLWRILGHSPPFTVDEGMAATAAWYRSREGARGRA